MHQAQTMYPGRATFDFHAGNSPTGFQADGFRVIVAGHVIAECEDSEVADFLCKAWNDHERIVLEHKMALETLAGALVDARKAVNSEIAKKERPGAKGMVRNPKGRPKSPSAG
jgi:hypothetical protein